MYGSGFAWDSAQTKLEKGPARISIMVEKIAEARRHVDAVLITNDVGFIPDGRRKPDFAGMHYLREWHKQNTALSPLISAAWPATIPNSWQRPPIAAAIFSCPESQGVRVDLRPRKCTPLYPFHSDLRRIVST